MGKYDEICVALDIESTGLNPQKDEIIEIAMVKFQGGKKIDSWDVLINPQKDVPYQVLSITGIKQSDLNDAEIFENVENKIKKFIGDYPIVGHNIEFDLNFLEAKGIKIKNSRYDTWHLATILLPNLPAYGLEFLTSRFNLTHKDTHRALSDTEACRDLFLFLIDRIYQLEINLFSEISSFLQKSDWDVKNIFKNIANTKGTKGLIKTQREEVTTAKMQKEAKTQKIIKKIPKMLLKSKNINEIFQDKKIIDFLSDELNFSSCDIETISKIANSLEEQKKLLLESESSYIVYLIPVIYYSILSDNPIVFSSTFDGNKLEEELAELHKIIPFDFKDSFIDSPYNYLCLSRFSEFKNRKKFSQVQLRVLLKILIWLNKTKTGYKKELALLREEYKVWQEINSDFDFCTEENCSCREKCFWRKIKEDVKKSDLILTNSDFLIFDFKNSLDIFKNYQNLIILNCHLLEDLTTHQLGESVTFSKVDNLLNGIDNFLDSFKNSNENIEVVKKNIKDLKGSFDLFWGIWGIFLNEIKEREKYIQFYVKILDHIKNGNKWIKVESETRKIFNLLDNLRNNIKKLNDKNINVSDSLNLFNWNKKSNIKLSISFNISGFVNKIDKLKNNLQTMMLDKNKNIHWGIAEEDYLGIFSAPEEIGSFLNSFLRSKENVILTSPAIEVKGNFDFIKNTLGISEDFDTSKILIENEKPSICIFKDSFQDFNFGYWRSVNKTVANFILDNSGNTLAYYTSLSSIKDSYKENAEDIEKETNSILAQGFTGSTVKILETLKKYPEKDRIILFSTDNILELLYSSNIRLKFDYLLITKLPFYSISNPVFSTRKEKIISGFSNYIVPRAIIRLKTILHYFNKISENRQKRIFILDNRITNENYGKDFLKSLNDYKIDYITKEQIKNLEN